MIYSIGDLVRWQRKTAIVVGTSLGTTESEDECYLSIHNEWVPATELTLIFRGNEGTIAHARNIFAKEGNANPPLVEEVAKEEESLRNVTPHEELRALASESSEGLPPPTLPP